MTPIEAIEPYLEEMHSDDAFSIQAVLSQVSTAVAFEVDRVVRRPEYSAFGYGRRVRMTFEPDDFRGGRPSLDLIVEFQPSRLRIEGAKVDTPFYELEWTYSSVLRAPRIQFDPATKISEAVNRVLSGDLVEASGAELFGEVESAGARYMLYNPKGRGSNRTLRPSSLAHTASRLLVYDPMIVWSSVSAFTDAFVVHRNAVRKYAPKFFEENCLSTETG